MKKLRVYSVTRRSKTQWFVAFGKEILSGPWTDHMTATEAKKEWIIK